MASHSEEAPPTGRRRGPARAPGSRLGRFGLRLRLGAVALAVAVPLLAANVVWLATDVATARTAATEETGRLAEAVASSLDHALEGTRSALVAIASEDKLQVLDSEGCTAELADLLPELPEYSNLSAADRDGRIFCSAAPSSGSVAIDDREWFQRVLRGEPFVVGGYQVGRIVGLPLIIAAVPIRGPSGEIVGTAQASITLERLAQVVRQTDLPVGAALNVIDRSGTVLVRQPDAESYVGQRLPESELVEAVLVEHDEIGNDHGEATALTGLDGVERLYAIHGVATGDDALHVAVGFSVDQAYTGATRRFAVGAGIILTALLLALALMAAVAGRLIVRPVETLVGAANQISGGDLGARTGLGGTDELGRLADTFDRMADSVQARVEARTADLSAALAVLQERDARLAEQAAFLDGASDAFYVIDPVTLRFRHASRGATVQLGYTRDELLGMTPLDIDLELTEERFRASIRPLLEGQIAEQRAEGRHRRKDGTELPVEVLLQAVRPEGGDQALVGVVRDISARIEAERRTREYLDIASDPLFIHRAVRDETGAVVDFEIVAFTEPAVAYYGPEIARVGRRLSQSEADTMELRRQAYLQVLTTGQPTTFRTRRRPLGSNEPRELSVRVTKVGDGVAVSARDITDDVGIERRIREYLDIAVDPLVVATAVRDASGAIVDFDETYANDPASVVLGGRLVDAGTRAGIEPEAAAARIRTFSAVIATGRAIEYEAVFPHAGAGDDRDFLVRVTRVGDGVAVAFRDITRLKRLQRALESARTEAERAREAADSARVEAERANQSKTEFLSRMSHELRTPLNAVIGFAQILELDDLPSDQAESVGHILRSGRHLLALINEVLDISRIESGTLTTSPEAVDVHEAVLDAIDLITALAKDRGLTVTVGEPTDPVRHVLADRQRLKQILLNLLSNAIKFNRPSGKIVVETSITSRGRCRISVMDEGPGIPEAMRDRVFMPFDRLGAETGRIEGTGLGLSLSRALAERMDGVLDFESTPGRGSTFWVELPVAATAESEAAGPPPPLAATATTGTVLYIEDNLSNLQLVSRVFERHGGVRVVPAMLASLGLELAREGPDLILLDLHLPDMGGEEVLSRLLADPATREIPVVVMSADASPGVVERLMAMGASAFVTKPIAISEFIAVTDRLLAQRRPATEGGA